MHHPKIHMGEGMFISQTLYEWPGIRLYRHSCHSSVKHLSMMHLWLFTSENLYYMPLMLYFGYSEMQYSTEGMPKVNLLNTV